MRGLNELYAILLSRALAQKDPRVEKADAKNREKGVVVAG
jgi:hypothetical protein